MMVHKRQFKICKDCKKERQHKARGLCDICYNRFRRKYLSREKYLRNRREYQKRDYVKAKRKKYIKEYSQRTYVKQKKIEWEREYIKQKEVKEKRKKYKQSKKYKSYQNEYNHRPEVIQRRKIHRKSDKGRATERNYKYRRRSKLYSENKYIDIPFSSQTKILLRDKLCVYCNHNEDITFDHIIPLEKGGNNSYNNLVIACNQCNGQKANKDVFKWCEEKGIEVPQIVIELLDKQKQQTILGDIK